MTKNNNFNLDFEDAKNDLGKFKIGVRGVSGSGKTMSALLLAYGLVGNWRKIFVVDTEFSAGFYANLGDFQRLKLPAPFSTERYLYAFNKAIAKGAEVVIFDSISHWWAGPGGVLEKNEENAKNFFKGNTWQAWSKTNKEEYDYFINNVIMQENAHIIFCMRTKTDYVIEKIGERNKVTKVGLKEIMRDGFEYELSIVFNIEQTHIAYALKDRTGLFEGKNFIINEDTGRHILAKITPNVPRGTSLAEIQHGNQDIEIIEGEDQNNIRDMIITLEYYLPVLSKIDAAIFERAKTVIEQKDRKGIKGALDYISKIKQNIDTVAEQEAKKYIDNFDVNKNIEEQLVIYQGFPAIIKDTAQMRAFVKTFNLI